MKYKAVCIYCIHMQFHTFFGINFIKTSYKECLYEIESRLKENKKTLIVTPNPEILYDAHFDKELTAILQSSDIAIPDGIGIFVGYQIKNAKLPKWLQYLMVPFWCIRAILHSLGFTTQYWERITGSRLTPDILTLAVKNSIGVTIIDPVVQGSSEGDILKRVSQEKMQNIIETKYPWINCNVIISDSAEFINPSTHQPINSIVIATHGAGKQEKILRKILQENPQTILGIWVGWSIDLLTWFRTPAPQFFRRFGWEWLYRLYKNPKKHSKRMIRVFRFLELCLRG